MQLQTLPKQQEFLLSLVQNNYSEHTLKNYSRDLLVFQLFLDRYNYKFENITKNEINFYKGYLRTGKHLEDLEKSNQKSEISEKNNESIDVSRYVEKSSSKGDRIDFDNIDGLNSRSINRMLSSLRSFLTYLIELDEKIPIPPEAITMVRAEKKEAQVAEFLELIKLIEAPDEYEKKQKVKFRNRAILELLFSTGMRVSELVNLDMEDVHYNKEENKIKDEKIYIMGKGKKQRYVYLTPRCRHYLERYLSTRNDKYPAFFIPYRGKRYNLDNLDKFRISQRYVQSMIKKYRILLGIVTPTTPHSLRHGFATYMAEEGANPAAIQRLLGHESLQTTTRYVHSSDRFAEKSHNQFHPLRKDD